MGLKTVTIAGRLVRDPKSSTTQSGIELCNFTVAVDSNRPQRGEEKPKASFFSVTAFGKKANAVQSFMQKGSEIFVVGDIELDTYQGQDGKMYSNMKVTANEIHFGRKPKGDNSYDHPPEQGASQNSVPAQVGNDNQGFF